MKYSKVDLTKNNLPLMTGKNILSIFYPYVPKKTYRLVSKVFKLFLYWLANFDKLKDKS